MDHLAKLDEIWKIVGLMKLLKWSLDHTGIFIGTFDVFDNLVVCTAW